MNFDLRKRFGKFIKVKILACIKEGKKTYLGQYKKLYNNIYQ